MDLSSQVFRATRTRLNARFGQQVDAWWAQLPETLAALAAQWSLHLEEPVGHGNTSLVMWCRRRSDDRLAVLKVTPEAALAQAEATALGRWMPSRRVPALWGHDAAAGALLLEAIPRSTPIGDGVRPVGLDEVAHLISALHEALDRRVGDGVVSLSDRVEFMFGNWLDRYATSDAPAGSVVSPDRVRRGRDLARRLAGASPTRVLLHGDLHPWNVLDGGQSRGLVAIDPRPCVGDAAFDVVDWVLWPRDHPENWRHRCVDLAELTGTHTDRIWDWCRTFAAMLAHRAATDGDDQDRIDSFLEIAP